MYTIWLFTVVLSFSTLKVRFKPDKFRVPVYQGFPLYEWNERVSFKPDKFWVPVNQGFPSHEWNENHCSTMYTIDFFTTVVLSVREKCVLNQTKLSFHEVYYRSLHRSITFVYLKSVF